MTLILILGLIAATLTTLAFLPQVIHILNTQDTKGISLPMYVIFCCGVLCWLIYGILEVNYPVIAANAITLVLAGIVLGYKLRYG